MVKRALSRTRPNVLLDEGRRYRLEPRGPDEGPWRVGSKGPLAAVFAALQVRGADGPANRHAQHLPGEEAWLICKRRAGGERKCYLSNLPADMTLEQLAAVIKAWWLCEQAHQQLRQELGLGHYEGRGWIGLYHHLVLAQIAFTFLQHLRLGEKSRAAGATGGLGRHRNRRCRKCGVLYSPCSRTFFCAALTAGSALPAACAISAPK